MAREQGRPVPRSARLLIGVVLPLALPVAVIENVGGIRTHIVHVLAHGIPPGKPSPQPHH